MPRIAALDSYRKPAPPGGPFAALTWPQQRAAEQLLWKFCQRWAGNLPQWRRAILVGQAKRLALNPPDSAWARRTLAKRRASRAREVQAGRDRPDRQGTAARRSKLRTNPPPQPQRRAGMIYILPPGIVPQRA